MPAKRISVLWVILCIIATVSAAGFAQVATVPNPRFEPVRKTVIEAVEKGEIPSMSIAVAKDGKVIWEESFGWANRAKMIKATPHTMYSMASISKPMATTGLMRLVEQGRVSIDEPVNTYIAPAKLTAFEGNADDAHVRHILNHTSGLPTHYTVFYNDQPDRQPPEKTDSIRRYGILVHPPGEVYQYANFGFSIADYIIEKVSGRAFADFMRTEVYLPLGMTHAAIDVPPEYEEYAAQRYTTGGEPAPFYISDHPGASQAYCSAHDLVRFGMFHLGNTVDGQTQILTEETRKLMQSDGVPNPDNNNYGLGWFLRAGEYGYDIVWHSGSMSGVNNMLKMVPSENIVVVVLVNTATPLRNRIPNDIVGVLLPDYGEQWEAEKARESEERQPYEPVPELFGTWEGEITTYESVLPATFEFQEDGDVHIKLRGQPETILNSPRFSGGWLTGSSSGTIPSADARRLPHTISYRMLKNGNVLSGYVSSRFESDRTYGYFSSYIRLEKK